MAGVNELQLLTTSIGEFAVDAIGRETINGLQVVMEAVDRLGHVSIALKDNSDAEQKRVLRELFDIERMYYDEAALAFQFIHELEPDIAAKANVPVYCYA
ncbi:hypothetical protein ATY41_03980 [Leifsonia xyli subsp. xyli]|uniref:Uncharacterized protein n=2 Tax=Leifsonia xyli TaxID=1575 RepID=A0A1E2SJ76_LEIXY|nr:hypothetical protein [Leifsonia xyli]ODA89813.1 hypothetical protein ATY41_03980 [Leifsonia xyli subsp. xyli]